MTSLLSLRDVTAFYGPAQALFGVSLDIAEGEAVALLGRNGMGKSTTVKTISRLLPHRAGQVQFAGRDLSCVAPHHAARLGLGLVPEGRRCFANLTVRENLIAAARPGHWSESRVYTLFPRLQERIHQSAATLSGGEQQMLAIARALMTNPKLLLLDEATEGLAPVIRAEIWQALAQLRRDTGLSLLVIDKSLREMAPVVTKAVVLEKGTSVWTGRLDDLTPALRDKYLGV